MNKQIKIIILGLGGRGKHYIEFSQAEGLEIVAICDSDIERLQRVASQYNLSSARQFASTEELFRAELSADACVVALPDPYHYTNVMAALEHNYHVLLEKPMALKLEECIHMTKEAISRKLEIVVCHVLRYAPFFEKIKEVIESGRLGKIVNIQLTENVVWWHYAHSFVRGIFNNTEHAAPFILAKSCHDLDIINYLSGQTCLKVYSEGGLYHFTQENAPEGAPAFCLDGCPHEKTCPYFAPGFYLKQINPVGWPSNSIAVDDSYRSRLAALRTGRFGRCVYRAGNNVNDHQSAIFTMADGSTASFNMIGLSSENTRIIRVYGTKGDLEGHLDRNELTLGDFLSATRTRLDLEDIASVRSGHGGGDARLFHDFVELLRGNQTDSRSDAQVSLQSHIMAFAADASVRTGQSIMLDQFVKNISDRR